VVLLTHSWDRFWSANHTK